MRNDCHQRCLSLNWPFTTYFFPQLFTLPSSTVYCNVIAMEKKHFYVEKISKEWIICSWKQCENAQALSLMIKCYVEVTAHRILNGQIINAAYNCNNLHNCIFTYHLSNCTGTPVVVTSCRESLQVFLRAVNRVHGSAEMSVLAQKYAGNIVLLAAPEISHSLWVVTTRILSIFH